MKTKQPNKNYPTQEWLVVLGEVRSRKTPFGICLLLLSSFCSHDMSAFSFFLQVLWPQTSLTFRTVEHWVWSNHIWVLLVGARDGSCLLLPACLWASKPSKTLPCLKEGKVLPKLHAQPPALLTLPKGLYVVSNSWGPRVSILKSFKHPQISAEPLLTSSCWLCSDPSYSDFTFYSFVMVGLIFFFFLLFL